MRLALVAGEASGDLLAGLLLKGLKARWPNLSAAGIGGPQMAAQGFEAWWPSDKLAVRGYVEVLRHYREIAGIRRQLATRLLAEPPDVFIGVDAPDFNLDLEARLKAAGTKAIHFICPSIWAWRGARVAKIAKSVDHVLCLFPFEPALLARHGIAATYVGHPLADAIPLEPPQASARQALGLAASDCVVALLPGSRRSEIHYIAPLFLQAAARLHRQRPSLRFLLPIAPGLRSLLAPMLQQHAGSAQITLVEGFTYWPFPDLTDEERAIERKFAAELAADLNDARRRYEAEFANVFDRNSAQELSPDYTATRDSRQCSGEPHQTA